MSIQSICRDIARVGIQCQCGGDNNYLLCKEKDQDFVSGYLAGKQIQFQKENMRRGYQGLVLFWLPI